MIMGVKDNKNNNNNKNIKNNQCYKRNPLLITQPILLLQKNHHLNIILNKKDSSTKHINSSPNNNKMTKINKLLNFNNNNS